MATSTHDVIVSAGYKLIDDSWTEQGRRTYVHGDDADRSYLSNLAKSLGHAGYGRDRTALRSFLHHDTAEIVELEPGGAETSGHFLHHMKPET